MSKGKESNKSTGDATLSTESLQAKIAELEAKVQEGEEAALKRVCSALNVSPEEVKTEERKEPEAMIEYFVPHDVRINDRIYRGKVTVPYSVFRVLSQAIGDRRTRITRELTGNNYLLEGDKYGAFAPKVVGKVGLQGEPVS